jgi:hypothetical protein
VQVQLLSLALFVSGSVECAPVPQKRAFSIRVGADTSSEGMSVRSALEVAQRGPSLQDYGKPRSAGQSVEAENNDAREPHDKRFSGIYVGNQIDAAECGYLGSRRAAAAVRNAFVVLT